MNRSESEVDGVRGRVVVHQWRGDDPRFVVLLAHGYGEHAGRYAHVAERLVEAGAAVYAPDHLGHGKSEGERVLCVDGDDFGTDLHEVAGRARAEHPGLPVVLLGHSVGGLIAARYAQQHPDELAALVLSGPAIGRSEGFEMLVTLDPIPEIPIDPAVLSRDPKVGQAYADDPLVWHGGFRRETVRALLDAAEAVRSGPRLGALPTLWIHGEEDALIPLGPAREAIELIRGERLEERIYPGARHEVFNETNQDEVIDDVVAFVRRALGG